MLNLSPLCGCFPYSRAGRVRLSRTVWPGKSMRVVVLFIPHLKPLLSLLLLFLLHCLFITHFYTCIPNNIILFLLFFPHLFVIIFAILLRFVFSLLLKLPQQHHSLLLLSILYYYIIIIFFAFQSHHHHYYIITIPLLFIIINNFSYY